MSSKATTSLPKTRYDKWVAAGRPKMADWVKSGTGISNPKGVASSGLLQKRLKAEPDAAKRSSLMNRYEGWLASGRPKMAEWVKSGAGKDFDIRKAATNRLTQDKK